MADTLSTLRSDLEQRIREIEPLIEEHGRPRHALEALKGAGGSRPGQATPPRARRTVPRSSAGTTGRPGRPRGSGVRAQQVLGLVHEQPGITIGDLAQRLKIKPNYLYRVVPELLKDGKLEKRGKGYHPTQA